MNGISAVLDSNVIIDESKGIISLNADLITRNTKDFVNIDINVKIIEPRLIQL